MLSKILLALFHFFFNFGQYVGQIGDEFLDPWLEPERPGEAEAREPREPQKPKARTKEITITQEKTMEERYGTSSYTIYTMFLILERRKIPQTNDLLQTIPRTIFAPRRICASMPRCVCPPIAVASVCSHGEGRELEFVC